MDIVMEKKLLRQQYSIIRKNIPEHERLRNNILIYKNLFSTEEFKNSKTVFCFIGMEYEINTRPIIEEAWAKKKAVAVPVLFGKDMKFIKIVDFNNLKKSKFGILEPVSGETLEPNGMSFIVVPGLVFSENFSRIGYGGGYYDKYFYNNKISAKYGIAYDCQIINFLENGEHEIALDGFVTQSKVQKRNS